MKIAYTNNAEFNKIFKRYNISEEQYSEIMTNNLLFDMTAIIIYYLANIENGRMIKSVTNLHIALCGKERFREICMKNTLKALFTKHGILQLFDICQLLLNMQIQEIEMPPFRDKVNIQKVINLLVVQLARVINKE